MLLQDHFLRPCIDDDVTRMIDGVVKDIEVESIEKMNGELEGADVASAFNEIEGNVVVVGLSVGSIFES